MHEPPLFLAPPDDRAAPVADAATPPAGAIALPTPPADAAAMPLQAMRHCLLCGRGAPLRLRRDSRCTRCHAPLAALPEPGRMDHELFGRRDAVRRDQSHVATLHIGWPSPPLPVRWRDLSLTGLSFYAAGVVPPGQRIHLIDSALEAVGEVVGCRPQGRLQVVHARLLAALLLQATGVFVSAQA